MIIRKIAFRNKLDVLSNKITREICLYIKENYKNIEVTIENKIPFKSNGIDFQLNIAIIDNKSVISVNGGIDENNGLIIIYIKIGLNDIISKKFNSLWNFVYKTVRHEIEHFYYLESLRIKNENFDKGYDVNRLFDKSNIKNFFNERVKYLSQEYEMVAFIRSLKGLAVKNKENLVKSIKDFVHFQLFSNDIDRENVIKKQIGHLAIEKENEIIKIYVDYAFRLFPNIKNNKL